ncbi:DUF3644 domain-containing protein [Fibrobacterota bacterium]
MAPKHKTFELIYDFLLMNKSSQSKFTPQSLSKYSGVKESTAKTYLSKKLLDVYVKKENGYYSAIHIDGISKKQFVAHMSQKSKEVSEASKQFHDKLKDRAIDSFFLGVELYNRVTQTNKAEVFSILIINAWELILKANIAKEHGAECGNFRLIYAGRKRELTARHRVEALMFIYFIVLIMNALIEREIRLKMKERGLDKIPIYPEERLCRKPTTERILALFQNQRRHILKNQGVSIKTFNDELTDLHDIILKLVGVKRECYTK